MVVSAVPFSEPSHTLCKTPSPPHFAPLAVSCKYEPQLKVSNLWFDAWTVFQLIKITNLSYDYRGTCFLEISSAHLSALVQK